MTTKPMPRQTSAFYAQAVVSFAVSVFSVLVGIAYLPSEAWTRAFLAGAFVLRLGLVDFPPVGTAAWWALRPLWLGAMALGLAALLAGVGSYLAEGTSAPSCPGSPPTTPSP